VRLPNPLTCELQSKKLHRHLERKKNILGKTTNRREIKVRKDSVGSRIVRNDREKIVRSGEDEITKNFEKNLSHKC